MEKNFSKYIFSLFFLAVISFLGIKTILNIMPHKATIKTIIETEPYNNIPQSLEIFCNDQFAFKYYKWIDFYGLWQKILLKKEFDNFFVFKDNSEFLHLFRNISQNLPSDEDIERYVINLNELYNYTQSKNIKFLYIQAPSDYIQGKTEYAYGITDETNTKMDIFLYQLKEKNIPYLDTRPLFINMPFEDIFYRTDHHWALPACFKTFQAIITFLKTQYHFVLDEEGKITNLNNYTVTVYPNSMLGSLGIRIGKFYTKKENYIIYYPQFETNLTYQHKSKRQLINTSGDFTATFVSQQRLHTPSVLAKYSVLLLGGHAESIVINQLGTGKPKCLIIGDSFNISLLPYISLAFSETRHIDPRKEYLSYNCLRYIDDFEPDIVLVLFNGRRLYMEIPLTDPE